MCYCDGETCPAAPRPRVSAEVAEDEIRISGPTGILIWHPHFDNPKEMKAYEAFVAKLAEIATQEIIDHHESQ